MVLQLISLTPLLLMTVVRFVASAKDKMKRKHLRAEMDARWQVRRAVKVKINWALRGVR
jgi:hypothetical protein